MSKAPGWHPLRSIDNDPAAHEETIQLFRAAFFATDADFEAMYVLARLWHFFDAKLETEEARYQRQCFIDLLVYSGMWQPETSRDIFAALRDKKGWLQRLAQLPIKTKIKETTNA